MSNLGDKSFAKQLANSMEEVVSQNTGNSASVNRYQAKVVSVDTTNHTASVQIGGSTDTSAGFKVRGMQFPSADDLVMVCIDGSDRWIESVVRPVGTGAYPSITLDWVNNQIDVTGTISGGGIMTESSTNVLTNKTFDTAGAGNVFKINGTQVSNVVGTGSAVLASGVTGTGAAVLASRLTGTTFDLTGDVTVTAAGFTIGGDNAYSVAVNNDSHTHTAATLSDLTLGTDTNGNYVASVSSANSLIVVSGSGVEGAAVTLTGDTTPAFTSSTLCSAGVVSATSLSGTSNITNSQDVRIFFSTGGGLATWRLFRDTSSERYKTNIVYMDNSDDILDVNPVTYHDKAHYEEVGEESPRQYGFLAEEMAENVDGKDYVVYNEDGSPEAVQYSRLVVPLHSAMRKMRDRIDDLEARLAALEAK
jgi:hypothetical protein